MKRLIPYVAVIALAAAAAGCSKGVGNSAYNNSGASATPASTTTPTTSTASTSDNVVTDTVTTGKVKAAFATDSNLKDADIIVKTDAGVVTLTGTAKSQDQVAMAMSLAQRQEGVTRVETQVVVR